MKWLLSEIARATQGELHGADRLAEGVSTDSRQIASGVLFIALKGERFDGHAFLDAAKAAQVAGVLVSNQNAIPEGISAVVVEDTRLALGRLAAAWRAQFSIPLIGVTGSNGKTTTKEMMASILIAAQAEQGFGPDSVLATQGNLNNDIGVPLTLLRLNAGHRAAVVEMGMNRPGEIAYLVSLARPSSAVATNAQRAHLEGVGHLNEIAHEKGSIYGGLTDTGVAAIPQDSPFAGLWQRMAEPHRVLLYGESPGGDVQGKISQHGLDISLTLRVAGQNVEVALQVPGRHNGLNALAAAATCLAAGVSLSAVKQGLEAFAGVKGRLQKIRLPEGMVLLDDTYNANPDSVRAGIEVLASTVGRKILVLGDMGEIGDASAQYHDEIGGYAKSQGLDFVLCLGDATQVVCRSFGDGAQHFKTPEALLPALRKLLLPGATVLVKGSRFMRMERLSEGLAAMLATESTPKEK